MALELFAKMLISDREYMNRGLERAKLKNAHCLQVVAMELLGKTQQAGKKA
jgi:hypothetical protein